MRGLDPDLLDTVRRSVLAQSGPVTPARIAAAVQDSGRLLGTSGALAAVELITAELRGLGPLQPLANDPGVTDLFVNAPDEVWLDRGNGLERSSVSFPSEEAIRALAVRLVAAGGRRLDDSSPCVDVRLPGGYRVHAVLPPVSTSGTLLSVRIAREKTMSLDELEHTGCVLNDQRRVLEALVAQRRSFLVSGATGSGKTTLLSALLGLVPATDRIVLVEDAAELAPQHGHTVCLEARHSNVEGTGSVDLAHLVREALRMRPDWLVVGECRGAEVRELLSALNTGHSGAGTVHANSAGSVVARLAALGALAGLSAEATALQAASALDAVVHLERTNTGRRVASIAVVSHGPDGLRVEDGLVRRDAVANVSERGAGWDRLTALLGLGPTLESVP
ncbi:TadA family conjugal transfer-associated ATPase [Sinomonas notoginsengisoli]|uniref:TadA family conjugal transfer-associated ATPase n=1 Tax=Sinomonas notoginsengisoli TaxID=1457311 RepID=UPI0035572536